MHVTASAVPSMEQALKANIADKEQALQELCETNEVRPCTGAAESFTKTVCKWAAAPNKRQHMYQCAMYAWVAGRLLSGDFDTHSAYTRNQDQEAGAACAAQGCQDTNTAAEADSCRGSIAEKWR